LFDFAFNYCAFCFVDFLKPGLFCLFLAFRLTLFDFAIKYCAFCFVDFLKPGLFSLFLAFRLTLFDFAINYCAFCFVDFLKPGLFGLHILRSLFGWNGRVFLFSWLILLLWSLLLIIFVIARVWSFHRCLWLVLIIFRIHCKNQKVTRCYSK
jgi:hypothetical protein